MDKYKVLITGTKIPKHLATPGTDSVLVGTNIYTTLGVDYEDRVLPSITNEVLKAVVAEFDAGELITQREMVSAR